MRIATLIAATLATTPALAGGTYYSEPVMVLKGVVFLLVVFICSVIFWWTYLWMVQDKGKLLIRK